MDANIVVGVVTLSGAGNVCLIGQHVRDMWQSSASSQYSRAWYYTIRSARLTALKKFKVRFRSEYDKDGSKKCVSGRKMGSRGQHLYLAFAPCLSSEGNSYVRLTLADCGRIEWTRCCSVSRGIESRVQQVL